MSERMSESLGGFDQHFSSTNESTENSDSTQENADSSVISSDTNTELDSNIDSENSKHNNNPTQATQATHKNVYSTSNYPSYQNRHQENTT